MKSKVNIPQKEATLLPPICPLCFPELWNDGLHSRKSKKKDPFCPVKKKKPVVVSDILFPFVLSLSNASHPLSAPHFAAALQRHAVSHHLTVYSTLTALLRPYIVYMLQDLDILEDWTAIRKVFWKRGQSSDLVHVLCVVI